MKLTNRIFRAVTLERVLLACILLLQIWTLRRANPHSDSTPAGAARRVDDVSLSDAGPAPDSLSRAHERQAVVTPLPRFFPLTDLAPRSAVSATRLFDFDRFFEQAHSRFEQLDRLVREFDDGWNSVGASPAMDIRENSDRYTVSLSMPHIDPHALAVSLRGQILTVRFREAPDRSRSGNGRSLMTRVWLPEPVMSGDLASATYTNGVLQVRVPKHHTPEMNGKR